MKAKLWTQETTTPSHIDLDDKVFGIEPNHDVVFASIIAQQASLRKNIASVKNRSQVSGGGRKPWSQKGTGRARQGTNRAPQWKGGGVVFGPNSQTNYHKHVNKKNRKLALRSLLTLKAKAQEVMVVDKVNLTQPSTKNLVKILKSWKLEQSKVLFVTKDWDINLAKSLANLQNVNCVIAQEISCLDLAFYDKLVILQPALATISKELQ